MKEAAEQSIVKKSERAIDDFLQLWKKRKLICVLLILGFLSAPTIAIVGNFWGLPQVKGERNTFKTERDEARIERDNLKNQLAPWQALAASIYTNAPPDKRLDLLLERVETLSKSVENTVNRLKPPPRILTPEAIQRIKVNLDSAQAIPIEISYVPDDEEALALAKQLKALFGGSKFEVIKFEWMYPVPPAHGIRLTTGAKRDSIALPRNLGLAFQQIFQELNSPLAIGRDKTVAESAIHIHVNSNVTR